MDTWLREIDRLSSLASEINKDIKEYHTAIRNNAAHAKLAATVRRKLVQLTTDIASLDDDLRRNTTITEKETSRRRDLIMNLSNRKDQLAEILTQSPVQAMKPGQRESLLKPDDKKANRSWGVQPVETEITKGMDNTQLVGHQKEIIQEQDQNLDFLSQSIAKQKEIAIVINNELDVHNKLLDDLDVNVEKTGTTIKREIKHVEQVDQSSRVGCYWIVIVILIVIIIVLAATDWGCKIYNDRSRCS